MNKEKTKVIWLIPERNYTKTLEKIKKLVKTWSNRYWTPLGKVMVIETNLISQCVLLLSSLPRSESLCPQTKVRDILDSGPLCCRHCRNFLVYAITQKRIGISFSNLF